MENNIKIQDLLGLKQEEMAIILKISRAQWSMYLSGKRSLPVAALLKLAEILNFVNKQDGLSTINLNSDLESERIKIFQKQIKNNQFQQILLERKIKKFQNKFITLNNVIKIVRDLETKTENADVTQQSFLNVLKTNAMIEIKKYNLIFQEQLQVELEVLKFEEVVLNKKMI
jgi:transcriptional regulator with XRE-family HTH domain